jgi:hypothetical protein
VGFLRDDDKYHIYFMKEDNLRSFHLDQDSNHIFNHKDEEDHSLHKQNRGFLQQSECTEINKHWVYKCRVRGNKTFKKGGLSQRPNFR